MKLPDDKLDTAIGWFWDVFHVVTIALLLVFVALAWKTSDSIHVPIGIFMMFLGAYMVGRWHAEKIYARDHADLEQACDEFIDEAKKIEAEHESKKDGDA